MMMTTPSISPLCENKNRAFTLVELMGVITIIGLLVGLTLGAVGAVRRQGATSQARGEIAALQAACDRYYADKNSYPYDVANSPSSAKTPTGSTILFSNLFGADKYSADKPTNNRRYFEPKLNMIYTNQGPNYFIDPWGNAYGYNCSTNSDGSWNAPLIWSTAGAKSGDTNRSKWITSWPQK